MFKTSPEQRLLVGLVTLALVALDFSLWLLLPTLIRTKFPYNLATLALGGEYLGPLLGFVAQIGTGAVAIYATVILPQKIKAGEQTKLIVSLAQQIWEPHYHAQIVAPAWEVAAKWLSWTGAESKEFRCDVFGGLYFDQHYEEFEDEERAMSHPYQDPIRFSPHFSYLPPADNGSNCALSASMVLWIWINFWVHLELLAERELINDEDIRALFSDVYSYWLPFMLQLRLIGEQIPKEQPLQVKRKSWEKLKSLENRLFGITDKQKSNSRTYSDVDYEAAKTKAQMRIDNIAMEIIAMHSRRMKVFRSTAPSRTDASRTTR